MADCGRRLNALRLIGLARVAIMGLVDRPVTEAQLRARLQPWAAYDMSAERRPLVVFDDHLSWDRTLFAEAYARRTEPGPSWTQVPPLPPSVGSAIEQLGHEIDLDGRTITQAHPGMAARWTDRGLVGLPAMVVWLAGIEHPYAVLTTEDLPPVMHLRDRYGKPIWRRHPGAYLYPDGHTLDVMFHGYPTGMVDYKVHQVLESNTAVTFSVAGTVTPGVEAIEDSREERWTTITLEQPLGNRFLISSGDEPLIVASATPRNWALDSQRPMT